MRPYLKFARFNIAFNTGDIFNEKLNVSNILTYCQLFYICEITS